MEILKDNKFTSPLFEREKDNKTERGELILFFVENVKNKKGNKYKFPFMAMKLAHLEVRDLYYFVSSCKDRLQRSGQETMQKYFWYSLRAVDKTKS